MTTLQNRINRLFDDPLMPINRDDDDFLGAWNPAVDLFEKDDSFVIKAELPGLDKKDISVELKDRVLMLKGERKCENEVKEENYYRRERSYGKFQRAFNLPSDLDPDKIKADFKDGVLEISIPKPEAQKPKPITIH